MLNQDAIVQFQYADERLTALLTGDIDHHSAFSVRRKIDAELFSRRPGVLALNLSRVTFMDSSGLGLILGRLNKASEIGAGMVIENPSRPIEKILDLAGIARLIQIERTDRNEKIAGQ